MDVRGALREQYAAGLAMLRDCVEKCPAEVWVSGDVGREFWRVAFHALFFTDVYLSGSEAAYRPWPGRREGVYEGMWEDPAMVEPYELPVGVEVFGQEEFLAYLGYVEERLEGALEAVDLEASETGFRWYQSMSAVSLQLMSLRHLQGHVGQLSELLLARGIDTVWVGLGSIAEWRGWEAANP